MLDYTLRVKEQKYILRMEFINLEKLNHFLLDFSEMESQLADINSFLINRKNPYKFQGIYVMDTFHMS